MTSNATIEPKTKTEIMTNGVNVTRLFETISAVRQQPELADFKFRARNKWSIGGQNEASISGYFGQGQEMGNDQRAFGVSMDEPPVLLGQDSGANPVEVLLAALSGCMTTTLAYHAASRGMAIQSIQSEYEGDIDLKGFLDIDPTVRKGYKEIRVKFRVKGDMDPATVREFVQKSPVFDSVSRGVPVKIEVQML